MREAYLLYSRFKKFLIFLYKEFKQTLRFSKCPYFFTLQRSAVLFIVPDTDVPFISLPIVTIVDYPGQVLFDKVSHLIY